MLDLVEFRKMCEQNGIEQEKGAALYEMLKGKIKPRKYGLVWEEQEEDIEKSMKDRYTVLHEVTEREIRLDVDGRTHSLIEGDNLEALTFLKNSGKKVDVIYIDPPYNTLSKDFRYNDHYVDKEDAWRHSKWLSFMNKRLVLARELLTEDGVIFISIDDNEQAQLKLLCDQVFGEQNFISSLAVENNPKGRKNSRFISGSHEYCHIYAKNKMSFSIEEKKFNLVISENAKDKRPILKDSHGNYKKGKRQVVGKNSNPEAKNNPARAFSVYYKEQNNSMVILDEFKILENDYVPNDKSVELLNSGYKLYRGFNSKSMAPNQVTYTKETFLDLFNKGDLLFLSDSIYQKEREFNQRLRSLITKDNTSADVLTETAGKKIKEIIESKFDFPKPVDYIKLLLKLHPNEEITILDFFAGSGTTAHAVLELNREDGGNRQVILCTNNENNIAEEVTYERIKRVMEGYTTPKGKTVEGIPGNLRYFKVDSVDADEDIYTLEDNLLEVVVPFIQYKEDAWNITTGKPGFTYLDDRVTIYNDPYHLDEDFLDHIKGDVFYIYDGWMDYLDIEELKDIRVVPIPKEFFKLFR